MRRLPLCRCCSRRDRPAMRRRPDSNLGGAGPGGGLVRCIPAAVPRSAIGFAVLCGVAALPVVAPRTARAVDPFEIQVYDGGLAEPGHAGLELHLNSVISGHHDADPPELPAHHQSHLTAEGAFGVLDWWEVGAYLQTALLPDGSYEYAGSKLRSKFVLPAAQASPFRWGVNLEVSRLPER